MSRVCRICKERKESDQFQRGQNGGRMATCDACRATSEERSTKAESIIYMRLISHEWQTIRNLSELRDVSVHAVRLAMKRLVTRGEAESREVRHYSTMEHEYKLTPIGAEKLKRLEKATLALKKTSVKPPSEKPKGPNHFAWLDLGADRRPNYNDNARYIPDTSGQKGFSI